MEQLSLVGFYKGLKSLGREDLPVGYREETIAAERLVVFLLLYLKMKFENAMVKTGEDSVFKLPC